MLHYITNRVAAVRRERINSRDVLVAPVVMLVEGVHAGSKGPLYYPADELARNVDAWNGVPVTHNHPAAGGVPISAKDTPELMVGVVLNTRWDAERRRLIAEVYIDALRLDGLDSGLHRRIAAGNPIEVSTGLYTEDVRSYGIFGGESYDTIARNYTPDHLALLSNGIGACSIAKGCGLPVHNTKSETSMCHCRSETLTPYGIATDRPVTNDFDYSGQGFALEADDEDDCDITPLPTFNAQQYEAEQARRGRQSPPAVNTAGDDEYDMIPPSTCPR